MSISGSDTQFLLAMALLAGVTVFSILLSGKRRKTTQSLATRIGFAFLGDTLPASLHGVDTTPTRATAFSNVIDGELKGIRVVAFDYRLGIGRSSSKGTAIAAQTDRDLFGSIPPNRDFTHERSDAWIVLYQRGSFNRPSGVLSVRELEALLQGIA